jgi:transporter family protein
MASFRGGATAAKSAALDDVISAGGSGPPFSIWITPALTCAVSYALYNISIKKASNDIDPVLGGVLLQVVAAVMGMIIFFGKSYGGSEGHHVINQSGVFWSVAAGMSVGMAEILSFIVSGKGVPATQSIPIVIGGSVLFGTLMGQFFLKETVSLQGWGGILLISSGIVVIGMERDRGSSGH